MLILIHCALVFPSLYKQLLWYINITIISDFIYASKLPDSLLHKHGQAKIMFSWFSSGKYWVWTRFLNIYGNVFLLKNQRIISYTSNVQILNQDAIFSGFLYMQIYRKVLGFLFFMHINNHWKIKLRLHIV